MRSNTVFRELKRLVAWSAAKPSSLHAQIGAQLAVESTLRENPHFRFVPHSSTLFAAILVQPGHSAAMLQCLLNNVDPTDAQQYHSLELAARVKAYSSLRAIMQHPSVRLDDAMERIQERCSQDSRKDRDLLNRLEAIFNK